MISAHVLREGQGEVINAGQVVSVEAPFAEFVWLGQDSEYIYFNVVCKPHLITDEQKVNLQVKTRFYLMNEESTQWLYKAEFRVAIHNI